MNSFPVHDKLRTEVACVSTNYSHKNFLQGSGSWCANQAQLTIGDLTTGLYLGGWQATDAQPFTHVLTIMEDLEVKDGQELKAHKVIALQDVPNSNLLDHFPEGIKFLESALAEGGLVYVHCAAGVSRSATVIFYMRMCATLAITCGSLCMHSY